MPRREVPIKVARAAWLRLMIPQLRALGFARLEAENGVELARLERLVADSDHRIDYYCESCEFDHAGPCEHGGHPAIRRGEIE